MFFMKVFSGKNIFGYGGFSLWKKNSKFFKDEPIVGGFIWFLFNYLNFFYIFELKKKNLISIFFNNFLFAIF